MSPPQLLQYFKVLAYPEWFMTMRFPDYNLAHPSVGN
jgi:hypothetical protein